MDPKHRRKGLALVFFAIIVLAFFAVKERKPTAAIPTADASVTSVVRVHLETENKLPLAQGFVPGVSVSSDNYGVKDK